MNTAVKNIVIVGGGTAGWLTTAIIAAEHKQAIANKNLHITLVESSDIPTIGVGEGTWPTLKNTLREIGISEQQFFASCNATFKQGGKFVNWVHAEGDSYYHPFTYPLGYGRIDLAPYVDNIAHYAEETNYQHHVCEANLAPRRLSDGEYGGQCNYAYHFDAGAFAEMLKQHCKDTLGVCQLIATVDTVQQHPSGDISAIILDNQQELSADLFIDCTGSKSLLMGKTLKVKFISQSQHLFNDSALALHVPYPDTDSPIPSHTIATAQNAGWIWDIGLVTRRGVGHVYSSKYLSDDEAHHNLVNYLGVQNTDIEPRKITFDSGHREEFWHKNCVAIGMSAGFVEPLEATAIMLIELSARYVAQNLPPTQSVMPIIAKRFNQQMTYRWSRIIDFLKLHYALSRRPEAYWQAHQQVSSWPDTLKEDLEIWHYRGPIHADFESAVELFPAASYQYVIYGMGFKPNFASQADRYTQSQQAEVIKQRNQQLTTQMLSTLPKHRDFIASWLASSGAY